ncbi:MAG: hypothetical protein KDA75_00685 [Planctomycetaceae bacterium]|nr:hypothetical protein [Planctomycetaceae bacterium]
MTSPSASPTWFSLWFGLRSPVTQMAYALSGFGLMALKYTVEAGLFWFVAGHHYTPLEFASPLLTQRQAAFDHAPGWVVWFVLLWSLPFVWIAVAMSVRRAQSAGFSPSIGLMVLLPVVNFLVMFFLAAVPDRSIKHASQGDDALSEPLPAAGASSDRVGPETALPSALVAILAGILCLLGALGLSVYVLHDYGTVLFFASPAFAGALTALLANRPVDRGLQQTLLVVLGMLGCAGLALLLFALEGVICILMATPIVIPMGLLGGAVGYVISASRSVRLRESLPCLAVLPLAIWSESTLREPTVRSVRSSVVINSTPDTVWQQVIAFPEIAPPDEWYFRAGIACPTSARIDGEGVDAVRRCVFTTGEFVEPITVWNPPHQLAFDVSSQPEPMFELSPYHHIHPPHLHGTFRSTQGEFRLVALEGGQTRLEGTTWYVVEMGPPAYWSLWTDAVIHRIHLRVLEHIREQAESTVQQ